MKLVSFDPQPNGSKLILVLRNNQGLDILHSSDTNIKFVCKQVVMTTLCYI